MHERVGNISISSRIGTLCFVLVCDPPILPKEDSVHVDGRLGQHTEKRTTASAVVVFSFWNHIPSAGSHLLDISLGKGVFSTHPGIMFGHLEKDGPDFST